MGAKPKYRKYVTQSCMAETRQYQNKKIDNNTEEKYLNPELE